MMRICMRKSFRLIGIILLSLISLSQKTITNEGKIELLIQNGHSNKVNGFQLTKDETRLISFSEDNTIKIWDMKDEKLLMTLEGHSNTVNGIQLTKDEGKLISYSEDKTIKIWDWKNGKLLLSLEGHTSGIKGILLMRDEKKLISYSAGYSIDNTINIWDIEEGKLLKTLFGQISLLSGTELLMEELSHMNGSFLKQTSFVTGILLTKDEKKILSYSNDYRSDKAIRIWDVKEGKLLKSLEGHVGYIKGIMLTEDESRVISYSKDGTVKIWDMDDGKLIKTLNGQIEGVIGIQLTKDETKLISYSADFKIKIWDWKNGKLLMTLEGHSNTVSGIQLTMDESMLISFSEDNMIKIWDMKSGKILNTLESHTSRVTGIRLMKDEKKLISYGQIIKIWDLEERKLSKSLEGSNDLVNVILLTNDEKKIISSEGDGSMKIWDLGEGKLHKSLEGHTDKIYWSYLMTKNKERLIFGSRTISSLGTIKIWDIESGKLFRILEKDTSPKFNILLAKSEKKLIYSYWDGTIKIWDVEDAKLYNTFKGETGFITGIQLSEDETKLIAHTAGGIDTRNNIMIWDMKSGTLLKTIRSNDKQKTRRMTIKEGKQFETLEEGSGHTINGVRLTRDERRLLSYTGGAFADQGNIMIWDMDNGNLLHTLDGHKDSIYGIQVVKDEKKLISYSADETIKIWDISFEGAKSSLPQPESVTFLDQIFKFFKDLFPIKKQISSPLLRTLYSAYACSINGIQLTKDKKKIKKGFLDGLIDMRIKLTKDEKKLIFCSLENPILGNTIIKIWDLENDKILKALEGHTDLVFGIELTKDEKKLISYSADNTIKIWLLDSGQLLKTLKGHTSWVYTIQFTSDEKKLISYSADNTIKIWDLETGKLLQTLNHYSSEVDKIVLKETSTGQKLLLSISNDSSLRYWDIETGKLLVTQLLFKNGESIYYTPDHYYMVQSQDVLKIVTFKKENKIYDFDQFDLKFNRPDIIMDRMRGLFLHKQEPDEDNNAYNNRVQDYENKIALYRNYYEHRIKQNGFKLEQLSGENKIHAPDVSEVKVNSQDVESKGFDSKTKKQKVKLSFVIEDEKGSNLDVVGYKVFVQGVPLHGQYMKNFPTPAKRKTVEEEITLSTIADIGDSAGTNSIEIMGYTSDGIESSKYKLYLHYESENTNKKGNLYLVTLGTGKYKSGNKSDLKNLDYTIKDADDLQKLFKEKNDKEKIYNDVIPIFFTNEDINREQVNKIRKTLNQSEVDDTVIFFVSGHGMRADTPDSTAKSIASELGISQSLGETSNKNGTQNVYYYMTSTSSSKEPWKNGIPMESFRFALDGIKARQKILLIDTCQSGEVVALTGYKPSQQRIDEIVKLRQDFKNQVAEKGIVRIKGDGEDESLSGEAKYYRNFAFEWELRELSKMFPELRRGTGTIEISAASGTQSALESSKWKNGAFTFTIKEAILEGKAKEGASITAKSLRKYILNRVERLTEGRQIPMVTRDISGRDFRIAK